MDGKKVVVYVRAPDTRMLLKNGVDDPAEWVRAAVKAALDAFRSQTEEE